MLCHTARLLLSLCLSRGSALTSCPVIMFSTSTRGTPSCPSLATHPSYKVISQRGDHHRLQVSSVSAALQASRSCHNRIGSPPSLYLDNSVLKAILYPSPKTSIGAMNVFLPPRRRQCAKPLHAYSPASTITPARHPPCKSASLASAGEV